MEDQEAKPRLYCKQCRLSEYRSIKSHNYVSGARTLMERLVAKGLILCNNFEYSVPDNPYGKKLLQDPTAGVQNEQAGVQNEQVGVQNEQVGVQNEQVGVQNEQNLKESSKENIKYI